MSKGLLVLTGILFSVTVAHAEVVVLKTKHYFDSTKKESVVDFGTKACGLKAIAFGVTAHEGSYVSFSQAVASYNTGSPFDIKRDTFNSFGLITAGEQSKWFELSGKEDCLRKVYLTAQLSLWPASQMAITVYGLK